MNSKIVHVVYQYYRRRLVNLENKLSTVFTPKIYCISFPKSGRTWLRVMIGKLLCDKFGINPKFILDSKKHASFKGMPFIVWSHEDATTIAPKSLRKAIQIEAEGSKLVSKKIKKIKHRFKLRDVIFIIRDPRDVVVSYYFQITKRDKIFNGTISEFIRSPLFGINRIIEFNNMWIAGKTIPRKFMIIKYEDMKKNPNKVLVNTIKYLGIKNIGSDNIECAIEFSKFENMRKMEKDGFIDNVAMKPGSKNDKESYKMRKGKVGGYKEYLDLEDSMYIEKMIKKNGSEELNKLYPSKSE